MRRLAIPLAALALFVIGACARSDDAVGDEESAPNGGAIEPAEASPTEALQAFYDALAAGNVDAALPRMAPLSDATLRARLPADLGKVVELCVGGELKMHALEHKESGRWACVVTRHERIRDGAASVLIRDEFLLATPDGWRIVSEPMRKDPTLAPLWDSDAVGLLTWFRANHDGFTAKYR
jgi:hypothetical protein